MKKLIILFGIVLVNVAQVSCSADSILGESNLEVQNNGDQGGGDGSGSTPIKPPPPPPPAP